MSFLADQSRARVAVVIPCFNQAHFLPEAVASVCAQTFRELEVVIVDDGSPDDTAEVASRLAATHADPNIRLVRQRNSGLPAARNFGIVHTRAEYVLPLDADDRLTPTFVERRVAALDDRPECSIAYDNRQTFGDDQTFGAYPLYDLIHLAHIKQMGVASMFRRRAWEEVGGCRERLCHFFAAGYEDWDFWIACGEHGHFGLHIPGAVFH